MVHSALPGVAGVEAEEESDADKHDDGLQSSVSESIGFLRPCLITTKVSNPRAALTTSWKSRSIKSRSYFRNQSSNVPNFAICSNRKLF